METKNIHETKTNLSRLLKQVQEGKPFISAKAGKPIARVTRFYALEPKPAQRLGFLAGQIEVPQDFDRMGEAEIQAMFGEADASSS